MHADYSSCSLFADGLISVVSLEGSLLCGTIILRTSRSLSLGFFFLFVCFVGVFVVAVT